MVSFICNACGQTVRKVQVEKHYQNECRDCDVLSCIDCGKDFQGDEYVAHTSCITEAEKYQGKLYKPKDKQNKGEHKQQEWLKQVREAPRSGKADPRLTILLERISEYSNIPRKKAKFQNFCKNSINVRDSSTLDKLWEIFSESTKKQSPQESETNGNGVAEPETSNNSQVDDGDGDSKKHRKRKNDNELDISNDEQETKGKKNKKTKGSKKQKKEEKLKDTDVHKSKQKSKGKKLEKDMNGNTNNMNGHGSSKKLKRKRNDDEEERDEPQQSKVSKVEIEDTDLVRHHFNWKSTIKAVLRQAPDQELPIKRLRKKVLAEFQASGANDKNMTDNELRALFEKKVTKNPNFKVHKDRVKLIK